MSLVILVSRRSTGLKRLQTIPKAYVAVKKGDVPKVRHRHPITRIRLTFSVTASS